MKRLTGVLCVMALVLLTGCERKSEEAIRAERKAEIERNKQEFANYLIGQIMYIKDPRTGLCFAYYWGGLGNGGPALATVPCEAIPPHLLVVANAKEVAKKK